MTKITQPPYPPQIAEIMQRIFRLKNRFKAGVPENIVILRKRVLESNLGGKAGHFNDFDLFHNVGLVFSNHEGPITMGELSRELNVPLSTATRTMDWLVDNEYAQRLPDPQDRRIVRVGLTDAGREIYTTINQFFMERIEQLLGQLIPEERETFISLLCKVLDALEKQP
jgi:DNA-binding MarR family transcriptional regulator